MSVIVTAQWAKSWGGVVSQWKVWLVLLKVGGKQQHLDQLIISASFLDKHPVHGHIESSCSW